MGASTFDINIARGLMIGDGFRKLVAKITGPTSYSTGGETLTPGQFRLGAFEWFPSVMLHKSDMTDAIMACYNHTTGKLAYYYTGGAAGAGGAEFAFTPADLKGATTIVAGSVTADQAALPVNGALYKAATANSVLAGTITPTTQPDISRNVQISFTNDTGGNLELFAGGGTVTFTITGTFRGAAQTDTVVFTVSAGQSPIAHTPNYRFAQGVKPFDTITSIAYDGTATIAATLKISAGPGSLIGLPQNRLTPADADVVIFSVSAVPTTVAGAFSDTNKTVQVGTTADAWDLQLIYKVAVGASNFLVEVASTTNLSGYGGRVLVHGK